MRKAMIKSEYAKEYPADMIGTELLVTAEENMGFSVDGYRFIIPYSDALVYDDISEPYFNSVCEEHGYKPVFFNGCDFGMQFGYCLADGRMYQIRILSKKQTAWLQVLSGVVIEDSVNISEWFFNDKLYIN